MNGFIGTSVSFLEDLYRRYEADPLSVDASWRGAFDLARALSQHDGGDGRSSDADTPMALLAEIVRQRGHLGARIDPLGRSHADDRAFERNLALAGPAQQAPEPLSSLYRSSLTIETAHIDDPEMRAWAHDAFERDRAPLSHEERLRTYEKLVQAEVFEGFLGRKYPTKKRFGAEGAESLFPLMDRLFRQSRPAPAGLSPLERLAFIGARAMGALAFEPADLLHRFAAEPSRLSALGHRPPRVSEAYSQFG